MTNVRGCATAFISRRGRGCGSVCRSRFLSLRLVYSECIDWGADADEAPDAKSCDP